MAVAGKPVNKSFGLCGSRAVFLIAKAKRIVLIEVSGTHSPYGGCLYKL